MFTSFPINLVGRDFAVGDIHGCFSKLQSALDAIGFAPKTDRLFSVGDLVDRGSESHLVLEWLDKSWFHAICGNHDFMAWRSALGDPYLEVDHQRHGGEWLKQLDINTQQAIGLRLSLLPLTIEINTPNGLVGLVHADCPYEDWASAPKDALSEQDIDSYLWSYDRFHGESVTPVRNLYALIHGHITIPEMKVLGNVHYIDTGGWTDRGHFTLLDLHSLKPHRGSAEIWRPLRAYR